MALAGLVVAFITFVVGALQTTATMTSAEAAKVQADAGRVQADAAVQQINMAQADQKRKDHDDKVLVWQQLVIFGIIDRASYEPKQEFGLTFEEMRQRYATEAATVREVDLTKEDLQSSTLQKILMQLQVSNLIIKNSPDQRYVANRTNISPRFDRTFMEEKAKYEIYNILMFDAGKWTVSQLGAKVMEKTKINQDEFNRVINELMAIRYVLLDTTGKVWCAANPPMSCPDAAPPRIPKAGIDEAKGKQFQIE